MLQSLLQSAEKQYAKRLLSGSDVNSENHTTFIQCKIALAVGQVCHFASRMSQLNSHLTGCWKGYSRVSLIVLVNL